MTADSLDSRSRAVIDRPYSGPLVVVFVHHLVFFVLLFLLNFPRRLPGRLQVRLPRTL
jgi:hypothetical protein